MEDFTLLMQIIWGLFDIPLNVYGYEFTFKQIFVFSMVGYLIFGFLGRLFNS